MRHFTAQGGRPSLTHICALLAIGVLNLASCAGPRNYAWGPSTTVPEPELAVGTSTRRAAVEPLDPLPPPPELRPERTTKKSTGGLTDWLHSGRGVTWGAARKGPVRDEGLDRMMADTLTSGAPGHVQEPSPRVPTADDDAWMFPSDDPTADLRRPTVPARSTTGDRGQPPDDGELFGEPFSEAPPSAPAPRRSTRTISLPARSTGWKSVQN